MKQLRERLSEPTFGAWSSSNPLTCEMMARVGYDWLILETQHRALSPDTVLACMQAADLGGTPMLVRVGGVDKIEIMRALDIGAAGVVVPVIDTAEEARICADALRYPPHGNRSYGLLRDTYGLGLKSQPVCILMIETVDGLANLEEIAAVPGVDVLLAGPSDLAVSMGLPLSAEIAPPIWEALDRIVAACNRHGVVPGCASAGIGNAKLLAARGFRFVTVGSDMGAVKRAALEDVRQIGELRRELAGSS